MQWTADPSLSKHIGKLRWPPVSKHLRPHRALFCDDDDDDDVSLIDTFRLPADCLQQTVDLLPSAVRL